MDFWTLTRIFTLKPDLPTYIPQAGATTDGKSLPMRVAGKVA